MLKLKNTIVLCLSPLVLIVVDGKVVFIKAVVDLVEEQSLSPETQPVFCLNISNKKHFLFFTFWWSLKAFLIVTCYIYHSNYTLKLKKLHFTLCWHSCLQSSKYSIFFILSVLSILFTVYSSLHSILNHIIWYSIYTHNTNHCLYHLFHKTLVLKPNPV